MFWPKWHGLFTQRWNWLSTTAVDGIGFTIALSTRWQGALLGRSSLSYLACPIALDSLQMFTEPNPYLDIAYLKLLSKHFYKGPELLII